MPQTRHQVRPDAVRRDGVPVLVQREKHLLVYVVAGCYPKPSEPGGALRPQSGSRPRVTGLFALDAREAPRLIDVYAWWFIPSDIDGSGGRKQTMARRVDKSRG